VNSRNFLAELKQCNVYKVAIAYAVVGWLVIQTATSTFPVLEIPNWATKLVIAVVLLGFPIALVVLKIDPVWDPIRNDPEFHQLLAGKEQVGPNK
jgi:hypothetical protein